MLDIEPIVFKVIRHVRPKFSCRACEKIVQAPAPDKDKLADQLREQSAQAKQDAARHGQADAEAYIEEMRRTAEVRKNPKAFE